MDSTYESGNHSTFKGSCLCQDVCYEIRGPLKLFQYCHCSRCRKVTGSAHASNIYVSVDQLTWLSDESRIGRYEVPEAKYYANNFCKKCGSSLPWQVKNGNTVIVPAGSLDELLAIRPKQSIHWASRATWYTETCDLKKFDSIPEK